VHLRNVRRPSEDFLGFGCASKSGKHRCLRAIRLGRVRIELDGARERSIRLLQLAQRMLRRPQMQPYDCIRRSSRQSQQLAFCSAEMPGA
jgi:hypothetical protein